MKNKKIITLVATLGLITCLYSKVDAVRFYDTLGTRYEGAVERLNELEIVDGVEHKVFNATKPVTRAEFSKMLVLSLLNETEFNTLIIDDDHCNFTDVSKGAWYYNYVVAATNYGLINGYADNTFKPDKEVTYEEAAKMMMKSLGHKYLREDHPDGWAKEYLEKMYDLEIHEGATKFDEKEPANRGNIAIMLWNMMINNVWKKIELNDTTGFTYVDSGETLFEHIFSDRYSYIKNAEIKAVKEYDGKFHINIGGRFYRLDDEETTFNFSMLGGKATALLRKIRDSKGEVEEEVIIGLSADTGMDLYEGTLDELRKDGFNFWNKQFKLTNGPDYGFLIYNHELDMVERVVALNSDGEQIFVDEIKIEEKKEEQDKEDIIEGEEDTRPVIKTININEDEYIINDGAVLFHNNKRVDWKTVKAGDVITEINKDQYYILTRKTIEVVINSYEKKSNVYHFNTDKGLFITTSNAECIEYLATKVKRLNSISKNDMKKMIDKQAKLTLDFTGKVMRIEFLDSYTVPELTDASIAYYYGMDYSEIPNGSNILTLISNGKKKIYRTKIEKIDFSFGALVVLEFNEDNSVKTIKEVKDSADINDRLKVKKITYNNLKSYLDDDLITEDTVIYQTIYKYDFGKYEDVADFEVKKVSYDVFESINENKVQLYTVVDKDNKIQMLLIQDYSNRKDVFYGKVNSIYSEEDKIKVQISILEGSKVNYNITGLLNCEEGDLVSFKIIDGSTIKILEKYTPSALGYYKDIVVKKLKSVTTIDTNYGVIDMKKDTIVVGDKEYNLSDFTCILLKVNKNIEGNWFINKMSRIENNQMSFEVNDRIAINEIENTLIIYKGYSE